LARVGAQGLAPLRPLHDFYFLSRQAVQLVGQRIDLAVGGGDGALEALLVGVRPGGGEAIVLSDGHSTARTERNPILGETVRPPGYDRGI